MKKALAFILLIVLCFSMAACSGDKYTQIGTSEFSIILPEGYAETKDDFEEDQIAYYFKDSESIDELTAIGIAVKKIYGSICIYGRKRRKNKTDCNK